MRLIQKIVLFIFANASTAAVVDVPSLFALSSELGYLQRLPVSWIMLS